MLAGVANSAAVVVVRDEMIVTRSTPQEISMEIFLDLTGADDGGFFEVGSFQVRVQLQGPNAGTDVQIISVGDTTDIPQGVPLNGDRDRGPTNWIGFNTSLFSSLVLADGDGLMRVDLLIAPFVTGDFTIDLLVGDGNTLFVDPDDFGVLLPFSTSSGTLTVAPIPEPSGLVFCIAGALFVVRRRSRRSSHLAIEPRP